MSKIEAIVAATTTRSLSWSEQAAPKAASIPGVPLLDFGFIAGHTLGSIWRHQGCPGTVAGDGGPNGGVIQIFGAGFVFWASSGIAAVLSEQSSVAA